MGSATSRSCWDPPRRRSERWRRTGSVVEASFRQQLLAPTSLEARTILVAPQGERLHVCCSHQHPHGLKQGLAKALGMPADDLRVVVPDAGGAFGAKSPTFGEYIVPEAPSGPAS